MLQEGKLLILKATSESKGTLTYPSGYVKRAMYYSKMLSKGQTVLGLQSPLTGLGHDF